MSVRNRPPILDIVLALVLVAAVLSPVLGIGLWGDDFDNLDTAYELHNEPLRAFGKSAVFFRPLMLVSMYCSYALFGTNHVLYNLATLAHHLAAVGLFHLLLWRLKFGRKAAFALALVFGTSPVTSEATFWSGARADVLLVLVYLLLLVWLAGREAPTSVKSQAGVVGLMIVALGVKESWVVLPVLMVLFLFLVKRVPMRRTCAASIPAFLLLATYGSVFFALPALRGDSSPLTYAADVNGVPEMVAKIGRLICHYVTLGWAHGHPTLQSWIGWSVFVVVAVAAVRQRNRVALYGGVSMILAMAPTVHFPVSPSRFNEFPLLGFWMASGAVSVSAFRRHVRGDSMSRRRLASTSVALVVAAVVLFQTVELQSEIDDYRSLGERHRVLVQYMRRITPELDSLKMVLLVNRGTVDGPREFIRDADGLVKNVYPKPGTLWNLISFAPLANFCNDPFTSRWVELGPTDLDGDALSRITVLRFGDRGFALCPGCQTSIAEYFEDHGKLPPTVSAYRRLPATSDG